MSDTRLSTSEGLMPITDDFKTLPTYQKGFHYEDKVKKMIFKQFGKTNLETSLLGLGASGLALCYDSPYEEEGIETVIEAVKSGINYIDTAPFYGQGKSELILGKAFKHIPRNAYYLATKVGRYGPDVMNMFDFSAARTLKSIEESLHRLGVDHFDILQVHDLEFAPSIDIIVNETLPVLQQAKECGKTKYIGITGYPLCKLKKVLEKSKVHIDVVLSYCRCTLFDDSLNSFIPYFKNKDMAIINAASMGMGLLTSRGPPDWHPASTELKNMCQKAVRFCQGENVDIAKIALVHSLSQPGVHTHLIGMENKKVLRENLSCMETVSSGLTPHEMQVKDKVVRSFEACKEKHWENKEVESYWEKMKSFEQN